MWPCLSSPVSLPSTCALSSCGVCSWQKSLARLRVALLPSPIPPFLQLLPGPDAALNPLLLRAPSGGSWGQPGAVRSWWPSPAEQESSDPAAGPRPQGLRTGRDQVLMNGPVTRSVSWMTLLLPLTLCGPAGHCGPSRAVGGWPLYPSGREASI